jgi:hypothetical protein
MDYGALNRRTIDKTYLIFHLQDFILSPKTNHFRNNQNIKNAALAINTEERKSGILRQSI